MYNIPIEQNRAKYIELYGKPNWSECEDEYGNFISEDKRSIWLRHLSNDAVKTCAWFDTEAVDFQHRETGLALRKILGMKCVYQHLREMSDIKKGVYKPKKQHVDQDNLVDFFNRMSFADLQRIFRNSRREEESKNIGEVG